MLKPAHKENRLSWCTTRSTLESITGTEETVVVHIDEKYFYGFKLGEVQYCAPGQVVTPLQVTSRSHIPKVMFLGAVAYPRYVFLTCVYVTEVFTFSFIRKEHNFNGEIGLWPVVKETIAKKTTKFQTKGDIVETVVTMDGKKFVEMCKQNLIPAVVSKVGSWASKVVVQLDGAGGHKVKTSLEELNTFGKSVQVVNNTLPIEFIQQPARSPDLNVLDLGAWNSIQSAVNRLTYEKEPTTRMTKRLADSVLEGWGKWAAEEKLGKLFEVLCEVHKQVVDVGGGNNFVMPHTQKKKNNRNFLAQTEINKF